MGNRRWFSLRKAGPPVVVLASLIVIWQAAVRLMGVEEYILPSPLDIAREFVSVAPRLFEHASATLGITLLGFAAGSAAGLLLAALLHLVPWVKAGFYPLLVLTQNVPVFVLINLFVIWFGFGMLPRLLLLMLVCFFPVAVAMLTGLTQADPKLVNYMKMIGATKGQLFWRLELPGSISYLFSGLKIAASYSVISAIYAESTADKGLGKFIQLASNGWQTSRVFVGIVTIIAISLLLFGLITAAERMMIRWRVRSEEEAGR
ncbi:ABC transporter permease [Paenibacillus mendelii]|uniref:ABC transporter permease n=1 Tax=Paenibacillus mendelii TaxID=206163 RepID=A0ABV6JGR9_9BACL|nr:ABC transporter permease [Paenibacillus mendelii]MCQ6557979.1 ABC transporter permease [Paenibacillus mendelii]